MTQILTELRRRLAESPQSSFVLSEQMANEGFDRAAIADAVRSLKKTKELDDFAYAERRVRELIDEFFGPARIRERLLSEKLPSFIVVSALERFTGDPIWRERAAQRVRDEFHCEPADLEMTKKFHAHRHLQRRGYQERVINDLIMKDLNLPSSPIKLIEKP